MKANSILHVVIVDGLVFEKGRKWESYGISLVIRRRPFSLVEEGFLINIDGDSFIGDKWR